MNADIFSLFNHVGDLPLVICGGGVLFFILSFILRKRKPFKMVTKDDIFSVLEKTARNTHEEINWLPVDTLIGVLQVHHPSNTISRKQVMRLLEEMSRKGEIKFEQTWQPQ